MKTIYKIKGGDKPSKIRTRALLSRWCQKLDTDIFISIMNVSEFIEKELYLLKLQGVKADIEIIMLIHNNWHKFPES